MHTDPPFLIKRLHGQHRHAAVFILPLTTISSSQLNLLIGWIIRNECAALIETESKLST